MRPGYPTTKTRSPGFAPEGETLSQCFGLYGTFSFENGTALPSFET